MPKNRRVVGGIDTHKDNHVVAVVDEVGGVLETESFPTTSKGYDWLISWVQSFGQVVRVGVEGTGTYGSAIAKRLDDAGIEVVEVNRPNRQMRRQRGKSDTIDAISAARSALSGDATAQPKRHDGIVASIRALRVPFCSLRDARRRVANQIHGLVVAAPEQLRNQLSELTLDDCVDRCARFRPGDLADPIQGSRAALRTLSRHYQDLTEQLAELRGQLDTLAIQANPALIAAFGVGTDVASILLVVAGDNPERLKNDAAFAALCGVSPIEASSGKVTRRRLNRGGDRQGNNALWRIVMVRLMRDSETKDYMKRRLAEGKSKREVVRCLKRYVAREMFTLLTNPPAVPIGAELRKVREKARISLSTVAKELNVWPIFVSRIERELDHDSVFATRYQDWLSSFKTTA
jgi:transposase